MERFQWTASTLRARRARSSKTGATKASGLGSWLADMTYAGYNQSLTSRPIKSMAAAEVWDAAVLMAPAWALGSGAAWLWALPLRWLLPLLSR